MESMHMTQQVFAQFIDISPASLSSIFSERTRPTLAIVEAIKKKIPNISTDWLMFGTGTMYSTGSNDGSNVLPDDDADHKKNVDSILDFSNVPTPTPQNQVQGNLFGNSVHSTPKEIIRNEIKYTDKPQRKITEIKVYFDDLTYETFVPIKNK